MSSSPDGADSGRRQRDGSDPQQPEPSLRPTSWVELVPLAIGVGVIVLLLANVQYGSFPPVPVIAGVSLYVVAAVEFGLGFVVRSRVKDGDVGLGRRQLHPITAARVLVLAKASAFLGSIALGGWSGLLAYVFPRRAELAAAAHDVPGAVVGAIGGALLIVAALLLERACRTPDDPQDQHVGRSSPA